MARFQKTILLAGALLAMCALPSTASASPPSGFAAKAQLIWAAAAPYYGQSPTSPMPSTRVISNDQGPRPRTVQLASGFSQTRFTRDNAKGLVNGADAPEEWLIHEWAHVFQSSDLNSWEGEGGAQAFARYVAPRVYRSLGIPFHQPWSRSTDGYLAQMDRVEAVYGWDWIMTGQWYS